MQPTAIADCSSHADDETASDSLRVEMMAAMLQAAEDELVHLAGKLRATQSALSIAQDQLQHKDGLLAAALGRIEELELMLQTRSRKPDRSSTDASATCCSVQTCGQLDGAGVADSASVADNACASFPASAPHIWDECSESACSQDGDGARSHEPAYEYSIPLHGSYVAMTRADAESSMRPKEIVRDSRSMLEYIQARGHNPLLPPMRLVLPSSAGLARESRKRRSSWSPARVLSMSSLR
uniref:Uncharacterized protein n=1 Tax=Chrysotila carterae TaxID=13221 RepID=A0A7S4BZZ7_CHRCT|mmetsp:Transcript_35408/g.74328  ORF Transcript_35408/g.74328 Transcript_35408/m.74328 type:complete len:240 (-) Transcript_35408:138-857(-)